MRQRCPQGHAWEPSTEIVGERVPPCPCRTGLDHTPPVPVGNRRSSPVDAGLETLRNPGAPPAGKPGILTIPGCEVLEELGHSGLAERAGLRVGDVVTSSHGQEATNSARFLAVRREESPGTPPRALERRRQGASVVVHLPHATLGATFFDTARPH